MGNLAKLHFFITSVQDLNAKMQNCDKLEPGFGLEVCEMSVILLQIQDRTVQ